MSQHFIIFAFLIWASAAGLILSAIIVPNMIQNRSIKLWQRALYCFALGPTVWAIFIFASLIAAVLFCVYCEKLRRAKKAKA